MAAILETRVTRAAGWSRRLAAFSAALFITAGLAHRYGLLESQAFLWLLVLIAGLAICALLAAGFAFARLWNYGDLGGGDIAFGTILALIVLAPFVFSGYRAATTPILTDISTDLDDPPALIRAAEQRTPQMNRIAAISPANAKLQVEQYPAITGRRYELPFDRTLDAVDTVLARQGWKLYPRPAGLAPDGETTIEAVAHSPIFAFPADVALRITDEDTSTYVDMRSNSRFGRHDLGDNADRIAAFLAELDVEIAAMPPAVPVQ